MECAHFDTLTCSCHKTNVVHAVCKKWHTLEFCVYPIVLQQDTGRENKIIKYIKYDEKVHIFFLCICAVMFAAFSSQPLGRRTVPCLQFFKEIRRRKHMLFQYSVSLAPLDVCC